MTFQKKNNYMAQVDAWLQTEVFPPITTANADGDFEALETAYQNAGKLIKNKLLESYRNGQEHKSQTNV